MGLDTECVGGGRISHNAETKQIKVYGYSQVSLKINSKIYVDASDELLNYFFELQAYGKADHEETKKLLLTKYKGYKIDCSDEGY